MLDIKVQDKKRLVFKKLYGLNQNKDFKLEVNRFENKSIKKTIAKKLRLAKKKSKRGNPFEKAFKVNSLETKVKPVSEKIKFLFEKDSFVTWAKQVLEILKLKIKAIKELIALRSKKSSVNEGKSIKLYAVDETTAVDKKSIVL